MEIFMILFNDRNWGNKKSQEISNNWRLFLSEKPIHNLDFTILCTSRSVTTTTNQTHRKFRTRYPILRDLWPAYSEIFRTIAECFNFMR